ncbi:MAG: hypothetical protein RSC05_14935 [Acinetobacter sp.]
MVFKSISQEYAGLLKKRYAIEGSLKKLPTGYISVKRISGHSYNYLQQRKQGKVVSRYLKGNLAQVTQTQLVQRKQLEEQRDVIDDHILRMEEAARIMNPLEARELERMKFCYTLDHMPKKERAKAVQFSNAIMTLEGISSTKEVDHSIDAWVEGKGSFTDSYRKTLEKYHLVG